MTNAKTSPHVAKANAYVAGVLSGEILACKWIRLACERHLRDMERSKSKDWPYRFDDDKAERICKFTELLPHVKGKWGALSNPQRLVMEPWQCFGLCSLFGWVNKITGKRRFRKARFYTPRKQGKSCLAAPIGLFMLTKDGEPGAEVYSGATNEKQAWEVFRPAKEMLRRSPLLVQSAGLEINAKSLVCLADHSKFEPIIGKPGDGSSPHCAIIDEYHEHDTDDQLSTMETGMGAREQPISLVISTAGDNIAGPCYDDWDTCRKILERIIEDDRTFCLIYTVDTEPATYKLQSLIAMKRLEEKCDCHSVSIMQMSKLLAAACAKHAIRSGGEVAVLANAASILIETLGRGNSAAHATSSSCLTEIHNEKKRQQQSEENGEFSIPTESSGPQTNGEQRKETSLPSGTCGSKPTTESTSPSIEEDTKSRREYAAHVSATSSFYAWITATLRELFEGFYAENATLESVISETLKRGYEAHSNICSVRELSLSGNALIETRPAPDWTSETALRMANPNYGVSIDPEFLQAQQRDAINNPRKQGHFKTKHLNLWVQARDAFINMQKWEECRDPTLTLEAYKGRRCWMGMDLASKIDLTALELVFEHLTVPGEFVRFGKYYLPESTVNEADNPNARSYQAWQKMGWLTVTDGNQTDYFHVLDDIKALASEFEIAEIAFDPHNATMLVTALQAEGLPMVEFGPTVLNFSEPMKQVEALIRDKKLHHNGDPVMQWAMSNVVAKLDRKDNIYPNKERPEKKIDPFIALCAAMGRIMVRPEPAEFRVFVI